MIKLFKTISALVIAYAVSYIVMTFVYCLPRLLSEYTMVNVSRLTENMEFPLDIFSWGLLAICAGYSGADVGVVNKFKVTSSEVRQDRIPLVIVLLIIILIESTVFNLFLGHDFTVYSDYGLQTFKGIKLPLEGISTALVSTLVIYITGNQISINKDEK